MWGSDAFCGNGGVLGVDGRSQDTPFFQHMMPKNQLDETHSARPPQSVAVVRGERSAGKTEPCPKFQEEEEQRNVGLVLVENVCWWFASLECSC